jgi:hypothetical protein
LDDRAAANPSPPVPAAPAAQFGHPWLDLQRFAQRRFLQGLDRAHRPVRATPDPAQWLASDIAVQWAALLQRNGQPVDALDVVICSSQAELWRSALTLLLAPGDTALLAEPVPAGVLRAIAQAGAQWLDIGRTAAGDADPLALERAAQAHPQAIYFAEQPDPLGQSPGTLPPEHLRATVIDLQAAGWPRQIPDATAVLLALRDPDAPAEVLVWALVAAAGLGQGLSLLTGDVQLPTAQAERARAVLRAWRAHPAWPQAAEQALAQKAERLSEWTRAWPGLAGAAQRGIRWTAQCRAGDAGQLLDQLLDRAESMSALGPHPGQNLLAVDLLAAVAAPASSGNSLPKV